MMAIARYGEPAPKRARRDPEEERGRGAALYGAGTPKHEGRAT
ncbi:rRNA 2'-O-methyltransferase fibrillarin-like [Iris pallida]|uniref:rRNA 2'-O-methyltransferase fibrillarin-like n=1 Tax=Iris pallida TaxID=29817 RepID=A0AAX6H796_IRIPA|nr:rRNA 2'-O-methyltransferase fibrillarin-like [Iris pallida]